MKTKIIFLLVVTFSLWGLGGCTKDNPTPEDPLAKLPPETQTGANTFGVTIRGKVYVPRTTTGVNYIGGSSNAMSWVGLVSPNFNFNELIVVDGASSVGFKIVLHLENLSNTGQYILKQSNFLSQVDSTPQNHIFFKMWDTKINNYALYGSVENESVINITRYDTANFITSGNFSGKFVRSDNPDDFIQISDGRFDTGPGIFNKIFP
jgi:hypothetical protein